MFGLSAIKSAGIALAVGLLLGGIGGAKVMSWWWRSDQLAQERQKFETYQADVERMNRLGQQHVAKEQEKERVVYQPIFRTLTKVVEKPVYRDCRIDDRALGLLNAAISGAAPAGREPDGAVRAGNAADRPGNGSAGAEGSGTGAAPQPLRR